MEQKWETNGRAMSLDVSIKCEGKCRFRVIASDFKKNSKYADRTIEVSGFRTIYLSFPTSPQEMRIVVTPIDNKVDYIVNIKERTLKTYAITTDAETKKFVKFAQQFTAQCGYEQASPRGRYFTNGDKYFKIKYFPYITQDGKVSTTPARIGHTTGTIEVSKAHMDRYTIAMRMCILLHEFSHVYRNPKMDLAIENEVGADLNALYIYLGLGYSKVDAIYVFANVFLKAQTRGNMDRMRKIMDYIKRFENEEFAKIRTI
jgi:hypothetical protein